MHSEDRKKILKETAEKLAAGISKQDIYREYRKIYTDEDVLAKLVASVVEPDLRNQYAGINKILVFTIYLGTILRVIESVLNYGLVSLYILPLVLFVPFANCWIATEIWKFRGYSYRATALCCIAVICGDSHTRLVTSGIGSLLLIIASIVSWYLGKKMFPNYGAFGPKKINGSYVF